MCGILKTKGLFSSGMVLQRNKVSCISGETEKNAEVILSFNKTNYKCVADENGNWEIEFNPGKEGGPFELKVTSNNDEILYKNVYVGEVWVSSGQSNAQLPMNRLYYKYEEEFNLPENPNIRMVTVPIAYSFDGEKDTVEKVEWLSASPENLGLLSGTAYFFAKHLAETLKVPVGIINASQGGSPIEAWMSYSALKDLNKTALLDKVNFWQDEKEISKKKEEVLKVQQKWDEEFTAADTGTSEKWEEISYSKIAGNWDDCQLPGDIKVLGKKAGVLWLKKEIELTKEQAEKLNAPKTHIWMGTIQDADKVWVNKAFCGITYYTYPPRRYIVPEGAFVEGKNTITVRIQKSGEGDIRFFREKPYCIFTDDVKVQPSVTRNLEHYEGKSSKDGVKIDLTGKWKMCVTCSKEPRPGEKFFEWEPTALYNSMLSPAFKHAVAGALWYQGESNSLAYTEYKDLLVKMIELWRTKFKYAEKNMPVVVAQLPNWANGYDSSVVSEVQDWAELRQAQKAAVEETENAGLAVLIDAGEWNDLHPESKKTVGYRAADEALRIAYDVKKNPAPKLDYCQKSGRKFIVRFNCGTSKLKAYSVSNEVADFNTLSDEIFGFEVVTTENEIVPAKAKLISETDVEIYIPAKVLHLSELRYLWKNNPWIVNLYSEENLPAIPFKINLG